MTDPSWLATVPGDAGIADAAVLPGDGEEPTTVLVVPQGFQYGPVLRSQLRELLPGEGRLRVVLALEIPRVGGVLDVAAARAQVRANRYVYDYEPPATPAEEVVLGAVRDLFPEVEVSITDNLAELGGDSLTAMLLAERLAERHGVVVDPSELFAVESFRQLARSAAVSGPDA